METFELIIRMNFMFRNFYFFHKPEVRRYQSMEFLVTEQKNLNQDCKPVVDKHSYHANNIFDMHHILINMVIIIIVIYYISNRMSSMSVKVTAPVFNQLCFSDLFMFKVFRRYDSIMIV